MCKIINTDIVLIRRLILKEYGPDIEYIIGEKNIIVDGLSKMPLNGNGDTTQNSTYQKEMCSKINDIEEIPEGTSTINLKSIQKYQRSEPSITTKDIDCTYHKGSFRGRSNTFIKLITCEYKIVILSILQSYVVHWYHKYLLHSGMDITETMIRQHLC